jgi:hypothetical protein
VDIAPRELGKIIPLQKDIMEKQVLGMSGKWIGDVPLRVDYEIGVNWGSPVKIINFSDADPFVASLSIPKAYFEEFFKVLSRSITAEGVADGWKMHWKTEREDSGVSVGKLTYGRM